MHSYKYLIIGGGAAGVSAAETIRQADKDGSIAIVSDEPYILYSRVMLSKPNFFLGKIPFDKIYLKGKDWYTTSNIDFLGGKKAVGLDTVNKALSLSNSDGSNSAGSQSDGSDHDDNHIHYEKLLIATGVNARRWNVKGATNASGKDLPGIHYLRTLDDGKGIMEAIKTAKRAVTIGGGFISFEMADMMKMAGLDTTMILREAYFWEPTLDEASGLMIENALTKGGVKLVKNAEVVEVVSANNAGEKVTGIILKDGTKLDCDLIICGIGISDPIEWLAGNAGGTGSTGGTVGTQSGVTVNHGIVANEFLETSAPDVWVAGDIAEYNDLILQEHVQMGNWVNAREQGRAAGLNMVASATNVQPALKTPFKFVSFYTTQGFSISIAFVGDVAPATDRTVITRGTPESNSYARLIIKKDTTGTAEIEGATMINRTSEMSAISKLIEKDVNVADKMKELGDTGFDLKNLV